MNQHIETLKRMLSKEQQALTARTEAQEVWKHMKDPGSPRCKYSKKECLEISEREGRIAIKVKKRIEALTAAIADMESRPKLIEAIKQMLALDPDYAAQTDDELREAIKRGYTSQIKECAETVLNAREVLSAAMKEDQQ